MGSPMVFNNIPGAHCEAEITIEGGLPGEREQEKLHHTERTNTEPGGSRTWSQQEEYLYMAVELVFPEGSSGKGSAAHQEERVNQGDAKKGENEK